MKERMMDWLHKFLGVWCTKHNKKGIWLSRICEDCLDEEHKKCQKFLAEENEKRLHHEARVYAEEYVRVIARLGTPRGHA